MRIYIFPINPISLNDAYIRNLNPKARDRRLSDEAKRLKSIVKHALEIEDEIFYNNEKFTTSDNEPWIVAEYIIFLPRDLFYLNNSNVPRKKDVSNQFKLIEDAIAEYTGVDDKYVISISGSKTLVSNLLGYRLNKPCVIVLLKRVSELPTLDDDLTTLLQDYVSFINENYDLIGE